MEVSTFDTKRGLLLACSFSYQKARVGATGGQLVGEFLKQNGVKTIETAIQKNRIFRMHLHRTIAPFAETQNGFSDV